MSLKRKIIIGVVAVLVLIQFIRPGRNNSTEITDNDLSKRYAVPENVLPILKESCYDCHSNNTRYPWYANVQPVGWWLQSHVNEGKKELNFSEIGTYSEKRSKHKFEEIEEMVKEGEMPLKSYLLIHKNAALTTEQAKLVTDWAATLK